MSFTPNELRLAQFFIDREGEGVLQRLREVDLVAHGLLDSLDMVSLAVFIEKEFQRKLDLTDPATFREMSTFKGLCRLAVE